MGVEGCTKCIKYLLFVFNFVFWLAGGIILGVGLWIRHDSQTSVILQSSLEDQSAPNTFYIGIYILIAVGAVMMFVGFLGCYGAIQESQCLLGTIAKDLKQFYDQALVESKDKDENKAKKANAVVKTFQETLNCCGRDSLALSWVTSECTLGEVTKVSTCHAKIDELFSGKLYLIGIAAIVVAVIMIFEMILSMVLCCGIRNSSVY
ncbi:CD81 antigen isoform X2 [Crotalus tigris]|uniref:CD81 antigen isoform X2 n=1 Tax=Crotalus tigris TaxID=88082 RepID=UPI00192FB0E3|nr:CD81 antigen isoform X2 [Crotalus tigris]